MTGLLVGGGKKNVKFRGIFRGKFAEKTADFAGIFEARIGKERPISWELPEHWKAKCQ